MPTTWRECTRARRTPQLSTLLDQTPGAPSSSPCPPPPGWVPDTETLGPCGSSPSRGGPHCSSPSRPKSDSPRGGPPPPGVCSLAPARNPLTLAPQHALLLSRLEPGRGPRAGLGQQRWKRGTPEVGLLCSAVEPGPGWAAPASPPHPLLHFLQAQVKNKHSLHFPCRPQQRSACRLCAPRALATANRETPSPPTVDSENPQALEPHNTFPAKKVAASSGLKPEVGGACQA